MSDENDFFSMMNRVGEAGTSQKPGLVAALTNPNQNLHDRATVQQELGSFVNVREVSRAFSKR